MGLSIHILTKYTSIWYNGYVGMVPHLDNRIGNSGWHLEPDHGENPTNEIRNPGLIHTGGTMVGNRGAWRKARDTAKDRNIHSHSGGFARGCSRPEAPKFPLAVQSERMAKDSGRTDLPEWP